MEEKLAVDKRISERRRYSPLPKSAAPWLVIPFEEEGNPQNQAFYNICEPNNKTCRKSIPELSGSNTFYQKPSHQGWLVIVCYDEHDIRDDGAFSLWNPMSLETIQLPNLVEFLDDIFDEDGHYSIVDCVLSSPPPPLKNASTGLVNDNTDSIVYFLVLGSVDLIVYCGVGDEKWRRLEIDKGIVGDIEIGSIIFFKDNLYVMCCDYHRQLVVETKRLGYGDYDDISLEIRPLEVSCIHSEVPSIGGYSSQGKVYFLESDEEIYMIEMVCLDRRGYVSYFVISINVWRLDFSKMSWEEVNSLGDTVLFLGGTTNACCAAAELGLSKGYLYYTFPKDQSLYMFDIEDKCTTTILPFSKLPTPWFSSGWIMMPPLPTVSVSDGGLDDYMILIKSKEMEEIISKSDNLNLRKEQTEENLEEPRPWMVISKDIVDLIASHLHPVDFLHFRAVCKANKVPIMKQIPGSIRSTCLTPWLLFSTENATRFNFVDPMHNNEKYLMNLPELLAGSIIHCQKGGWLLMSKGRFPLFFYNPFTKETIQLPESQCGYGFSGISFSSLPTCSDCVIFGITQQNEEEICIYVIKRGADNWRFPIFENSDLEKYMPTFNAPVFHKGAFYCVDYYNGTLGVFNEHKWSWSVLKWPRGFSNAAYVSFLVECEDELLLVRILRMSVTIFRLDSLKMVWRKVKSLGKHILFVNFTSCLSAVAPKSYMENKVYFPRMHDERIVYYSLETGGYHSVGSTHSAKDYLDTKCWTNCSWIEPNWTPSTSQELDWLIKNPL